MNTIYHLLKTMISSNRYNKEDLANKLDVFYAMGRITQEQYLELMEAITPPVMPLPVKEEVKEEEPTPVKKPEDKEEKQ